MKNLSSTYAITSFRTTTVLTVLYCGMHTLSSKHVCTCLGELYLFASDAKNLFQQIHVNTRLHVFIRDISQQSNTDCYLSIESNNTVTTTALYIYTYIDRLRL